jgi:type VI secretion system protein ImpA
VKPAAQVGIAVAPERIQSRDDAFQQLSKIAEYFRRTEPQSPIATAIEEVVRRGKLSFAELAAELIPDESARRNFMITAGIKPK